MSVRARRAARNAMMNPKNDQPPEPPRPKLRERATVLIDDGEASISREPKTRSTFQDFEIKALKNALPPVPDKREDYQPMVWNDYVEIAKAVNKARKKRSLLGGDRTAEECQDVYFQERLDRPYYELPTVKERSPRRSSKGSNETSPSKREHRSKSRSHSTASTS